MSSRSPVAGRGRPAGAATGAAAPRLRGWLHAGAFPLALAGGIILIGLAPTARAAAGCAVFAASSCLLFGVSALYHLSRAGTRARARLRRIDHANIFLVIAGTYTALAAVARPSRLTPVLLGLVWAGALTGIAMRTFWLTAPRWVYVPCYLLLGWTVVFCLPVPRRDGAAVGSLMIIAAVLYSIGAVVYGLKRPNPSPRWFGFHEIFHGCTLAGFACQYTAITIAVYSSR
jgi:hemolysin III